MKTKSALQEKIEALNFVIMVLRNAGKDTTWYEKVLARLVTRHRKSFN